MAARTKVQVIIDAKDNASRTLKGLGKSFRGLGTDSQEAKMALLGVSAAITAAGIAAVKFAVDTAFASARIGELELALSAMSKATGISQDTIDDTVRSLRDLNIAHRIALESVGLFMTANIDLADATKLARTAQDLAVIAAMDSSEAFRTLTTAIATQRPILLRQFGIAKTLDQIYTEYAKSVGMVTTKTRGLSTEFTEAQKKAAFMHAVLTQGAKVAGVYEASMGSVSKRFRSLTGRVIPDFKVAVGKAFEPALIVVVDKLYKIFGDLTKQIKSGEIGFEGLGNILKIFADIFAKVLDISVQLLKVFLKLPPAVQIAMTVFVAAIPILTSVGFAIKAITIGMGALTGTIVGPLAIGIAGLVLQLYLLKRSFEKGAEGAEYWKTTVIPGIIAGFDRWKVKMGESKQAWSDLFESMGVKIDEFNTRMGESIDLWKALFSDFISWYQTKYIEPAKAGMGVLRESFAMTSDQWADALGQTLADIDNWVIGMMIRFERWQTYTSWAFQEVEKTAVISFGNWLLKTDEALENWTHDSFVRFAYWKMYTSWAFQEVEKNAIISFGNWMIKTREDIKEWVNTTKIAISNWKHDTLSAFLTWEEQAWLAVARLRDKIENFIKTRMEQWRVGIPMIWSEIADKWTFQLDRIGNSFRTLGGKIDAVRGKISDWWSRVQEAREAGAEFQTGGVVPGPIGQPVPILAHGGERVVPAGADTGRGGGEGGGIVLHVNIGLYAGTETEKRNIARELYGALLQVAQAQNKTVAELMGG